MDINEKLSGALKVMGFDSIRPGQERIIEPLMDGKDVIGIMPTGGGKSATFILPTLTKRWRTLVISPLISLQQDQVHKLVSRKVAAAAINSTTRNDRSERYMMGWARGQLNFLYVAPERLAIDSFAKFIEQRSDRLADLFCFAGRGTSPVGNRQRPVDNRYRRIERHRSDRGSRPR